MNLQRPAKALKMGENSSLKIATFPTELETSEWTNSQMELAKKKIA